MPDRKEEMRKMKKNTILAILVLVAVVIAFSFLPLSSAKKPPKPTALAVTLGPEGVGVLFTVGSSCDVTEKPATGTPVEMKRGPKGTIESTGPVAVWFDFSLTHSREHLSTFVLPACVETGLLRVEFDDMNRLVFVQMFPIDETVVEGKVTHTEAFVFAAHEVYPGTESYQTVDGYFDSFIRHYDSHDKGKDKGHVEIVFRVPLAITGTLS